MTRVDELEREIAAEKAAEAAAAAAAAREARDRGEVRKRAAAALAGEVAAAEKQLPRTLAAAEAAAAARGPFSMGDRWNARRLLLGNLLAPDDVGELGLIGRSDRAFELVAGAMDSAARLVLTAERELGVDDPLTRRAAVVECELHRALQTRARAIGDGETG